MGKDVTGMKRQRRWVVVKIFLSLLDSKFLPRYSVCGKRASSARATSSCLRNRKVNKANQQLLTLGAGDVSIASHQHSRRLLVICASCRTACILLRHNSKQSSALDFRIHCSCILLWPFTFAKDESMSTSASHGPRQRNSTFSRDPLSPSPSPLIPNSRPKSAIYNSPTGVSSFSPLSGNQAFSPLSGSNLIPVHNTRPRSMSNRSYNQTSNTFAPSFIKTAELHEDNDRIGGIEGENDFSGKRYVWLQDPHSAFMKGWIVEEYDDGRLLVQCDDGSVRS